MQKFLVIGLNVFGQHFAKSLNEYGSAVTGLDLREDRLEVQHPFSLAKQTRPFLAARSEAEQTHGSLPFRWDPVSIS